MSQVPTISVIVPVYNGERYLETALRSVLNADWPQDALELLVIDDGSSDGSRDILQHLKDKRLRVEFNKRNMGVAASLNRLLDLATGDFIARMDADDVCLPHRFRAQIRYFRAHSDVGILGGQVICFPGEPRFPKMPTERRLLRAFSLFASPLIHPTVMWRRELNLRYTVDPPTAEDYDLWVRAMTTTRVANLSQPLLQYRQDFSVKKQSYLEEQKRGGSDIRRRLLQELGLDPEPLQLQIHEKLSNLWGHSGDPSPADVAAWLHMIEEGNHKTGMMDAAALRHLLAHKWYDYHLYYLLQGNSRMAHFSTASELSNALGLSRRCKLEFLAWKQRRGGR